MRRFSLILVPLLSLCLIAGASGPQAPQGPPSSSSVPLVLVGGTLIDLTAWGDSAKDIPNVVVVIHEGRILEVGPAAEVAIPKGANVIECAGKFILPGLVDGYAGMNSQGAANANLYMGVTTVVARQDSERGIVDLAANPSPHIYPIDSIGTSDNWSRLVRQPQWISALREGARPVELAPQQIARQMTATAQLGTRVLLIGHDIRAANTQWIISRAHEMGLVTYGEFVSTPYEVGIAAGVDALPLMGQYELGVIPEELQHPLVDDPDGSASRTAYDYSQRIPPSDLHLRSYARFLETHHSALMPAFSRYWVQLPEHRNLWKEPVAALMDTSRMYKPTNRATGEMDYPLPFWAKRLPGAAQRWLQAGEQKKAEQAAMRLWQINQSLFSTRIHYLAASGADAMGTMPGISLHTELEMLVRLGLSPREALAAATNNYALQFGWSELGLIAPGRRADVLVVDSNPIENVWNARRISTLIVDGEVVNREALLNLRR
jgi:hypothetical protein